MPTMNVNATVFIKSTPEKIFPIISNLSHWEKWSPWVIAEPSANLSITKDGKYHEWEGDIIGSGNLKIIDEIENQNLTMDLNFLKPWKSHAATQLQLIPRKDGTLVTWTMKSHLPFFLFWMRKQMEILVGMDYNRGLFLLKDLIETGSTNSSLNFKGNKPFHATQYVGIKRSCAFSRIGEHMEKDFKTLMPYLMENCREQLTGNGLSIYNKTDVIKDRVVYTAAHPVSEIPKNLPDHFTVGEMPKFNAYTIRHTGPYRHIGNAWAAGMMHQRNKLFKPAKGIPPIEVMYNSPVDTPENELISEILFPMR